MSLTIYLTTYVNDICRLKLKCIYIYVCVCVFGYVCLLLGAVAVAESAEQWPRVLEIVGSNPGRVKPMTYQIDICRLLARCSALLGEGKD